MEIFSKTLVRKTFVPRKSYPQEHLYLSTARPKFIACLQARIIEYHKLFIKSIPKYIKKLAWNLLQLYRETATAFIIFFMYFIKSACNSVYVVITYTWQLTVAPCVCFGTNNAQLPFNHTGNTHLDNWILETVKTMRVSTLYRIVLTSDCMRI